MSHFIAQQKENLISVSFPVREELAPVALLQRKICNNDRELTLDCLVRIIKVDNRPSLLSRVTYSFDRARPLTSREALHYAEVINCLLVHSQVFVIQDIDGDRYYSLQMDTLSSAPRNRRNLARFLDNIAQDVSILIQYCQSKASDTLEDAADSRVIPFTAAPANQPG